MSTFRQYSHTQNNVPIKILVENKSYVLVRTSTCAMVTTLVFHLKTGLFFEGLAELMLIRDAI